MKTVRKTKKSNKIAKIIFAVAVLIYFGVVFVRQEIAIQDLKKDAIDLSAQMVVQQEERQRIETQMNRQSELERIEKVARDKLGFLRGNERVFVDSSSR